MDTLLLVIPDWNLRQLYHELLLSKNIEIIPLVTIESAMLVLFEKNMSGMMIYVDSSNSEAVETFLNLRKRYQKWSQNKVILLTNEKERFLEQILPTDLLLDPFVETPLDIVNAVKDVV